MVGYKDIRKPVVVRVAPGMSPAEVKLGEPGTRADVQELRGAELSLYRMANPQNIQDQK
jgi:hypothetical protein